LQYIADARNVANSIFFFYFFPLSTMQTFRWFNRIAILLVMITIVAGAASCSNNSTASGPSKTELLTRAGGWKYDKFTQGDIGLGVAAYPGMILKFTSSGSMTMTLTSSSIAAVKALGVDLDPSYTGTWSFNADQTQISFNVPPFFTSPLRVSDLSSTTLRLTGSVPGTTQVLESQWAGN
jgi:hypothetical protein